MRDIFLNLNFHFQQQILKLYLYLTRKTRKNGLFVQMENICLILHCKKQKMEKMMHKIQGREAILERTSREQEAAKTRSREMRTKMYWILENMWWMLMQFQLGECFV